MDIHENLVFKLTCSKIYNAVGQQRNLYSENVGKATKQVFCKIQKLVQPSSPNTIIGHFKYYIYIYFFN